MYRQNGDLTNLLKSAQSARLSARGGGGGGGGAIAILEMPK